MNIIFRDSSLVFALGGFRLMRPSRSFGQPLMPWVRFPKHERNAMTGAKIVKFSNLTKFFAKFCSKTAPSGHKCNIHIVVQTLADV